MTAETTPFNAAMSNTDLLLNIEDLVFTNSYAETGSDRAKAYQADLHAHLSLMEERGFKTVSELIQDIFNLKPV